MLRRTCFTLTISLLFVAEHALETVGQTSAGPANSSTSNAKEFEQSIRIATYNVSLYRAQHGQLVRDLAGGKNQQAHRLAQVIREIRPDVLLLNEFDYDEGGLAAEHFCKLYLEAKSGKTKPLQYAYRYLDEVNTGVLTGLDLNGDGVSDGPNDAFGFGTHPGQYGMLVLSKFPIRSKQVRTFRKFLWKDMPDAKLPYDPKTKDKYYGPAAEAIFRLSSKSHWDVPIQVAGTTLHFLVSHPTPPVFDGDEDRNGKRNHDEIRLFADYIDPMRSDYLVDDVGGKGGLPAGSHFVIAGDLNSDPNDGASFQSAIRQLTKHPLIQAEPIPRSDGGAAAKQTEANSQHRGDPAFDTADFDDRWTGNLRADYVLPSRTMKILDCGVFWPIASRAKSKLASATDHRMVWIDVAIDKK